MRYRLGFVSNSSSASYFIVIKNANLDEVFKDFIEKAYGYQIDKKNILELLNAELEELTNRNNDIKTTNSQIGDALQGVWQEHFKRIDGLKARLISTPEKDLVNLLKILLNYSIINYSQINNDTHIEYMTVMHNGFDDSMPSLLKEFILFLNFYTKHNVEYTIEQEDSL